MKVRVRHNQGAHVVADSHVKWFRAPQPNYHGSAATIRTTEVVAHRIVNPTAGAWFRED